MSVYYSPAKTPGIIRNHRKRMLRHRLVDVDSISLLDNNTPDDETIAPVDTMENDLLTTDQPDTKNPSSVDTVVINTMPVPNDTNVNDDSNMDESVDYNPAIGDISSPITKEDHDITKIKNTKEPSLLTNKKVNKKEDVLDTTEDDKDNSTVPDNVLESQYYNETALKSKQRNALPDDAFGLPRLRAYPLIDRKHVLQAIRMFSHCKNKKDQKTLASNIVKKIEEFHMTVSVGKENPLYNYLPKNLQESAYPMIQILQKSNVKLDPIQEFIMINNDYCNNLFYNNDFSSAIKMIAEYNFLDYLYPSFKTINFPMRIHTALGGLAINSEVFHELKLRSLDVSELGNNLGWCNPDNIDNFDVLINTYYDKNDNWFGVDLSNDINHILYCLRFYNILGEIMLNPNFNEDILTDDQIALLLDWQQYVNIHYDLFKEANDNSKEALKQAQYLYDLCWDITDNPYNSDDISANIISVVKNMASSTIFIKDMNENKDTTNELKEKYKSFLIDKLQMSNDIFLLPDQMKYPILTAGSVKIAMDTINQVAKEDKDSLNEYVKNLNRKYKEFGCKFSISIDHPYAKYADQNIIDNMLHYLIEGDTAVDDDGTSASTDEVQPWYKRVDYFDAVSGSDREILTNKELGPNMKPTKDPEFGN